MTRRTGLGRGINALIPGSEPLPAGVVQEVPISRIVPNPRQPRKEIKPEELAELAESIRLHGILQPLIATYLSEEPDHYILIAGHRRLEAARLAGLETVPAILRTADDQQQLELALIENLQRADLSPLDQAEAYQKLANEFGLSHDEISSRVGKSRVSVTNTLRLLRLTPHAQQALRAGEISEGHARALLALSTSQAQNAALQTVIQQGLSVRQTEELVRRLAGERPQPKSRPAQAPEIRDLEDRLRHFLGTKVNLNRRGKGGTLVIYYYSDEELNSVIRSILREE
jgi:ParB family chromosome partitioning protein